MTARTTAPKLLEFLARQRRLCCAAGVPQRFYVSSELIRMPMTEKPRRCPQTVQSGINVMRGIPRSAGTTKKDFHA